MQNPDKRFLFRQTKKEIRKFAITYVHVVDEEHWMVSRAKSDAYDDMKEPDNRLRWDQPKRNTEYVGEPELSGGSGSSDLDPEGGMTYVIVGDGNLLLDDVYKQEMRAGALGTGYVNLADRRDLIISSYAVGRTLYDGLKENQVPTTEASAFFHLLLDNFEEGAVTADNAARRLIGIGERKGGDTEKDMGNYDSDVFLFLGEESDQLLNDFINETGSESDDNSQQNSNDNSNE